MNILASTELPASSHSTRDPVLLAWQAMALDDLSNGRMILWVGAGWNEAEHSMFGYALGDRATRMRRLEAGLVGMSRPCARMGRRASMVMYSGCAMRCCSRERSVRAGRRSGSAAMGHSGRCPWSHASPISGMHIADPVRFVSDPPIWMRYWQRLAG